jgi:hypothetical protein
MQAVGSVNVNCLEELLEHDGAMDQLEPRNPSMEDLPWL